MHTDVTPAPVGARRPRGLLRAVLALGVFVLSVGVVFAPQPASADTGTAVAVAVAGAKKAAPRIAMGAATANPYGLAAAGIAFVGMAAWETRDVWVPWAQDLLNGDKPAPDPSGSNSLSTTSFSVERHGADVGAVTVTWSRSDTGSVERSQDLQSMNTLCSGPGGTYSGYDTGAGSTAGPNLPRPGGVTTMGICSPGDQIVSGAFRVWQSAYGLATQWQYLSVAGYPAKDHTTTTAVQCRLPDGTLATINGSISGEPDKVPIPSCTAAHPGSYPERVTVSGGRTGATPETYLDVPTVTPDFINQYADCFGPSGMTCWLEVEVDGTTCVLGASNCAYWWSTANRFPDRVVCRFGTYALPIDQCEPLRHAYRKPHEVTRTKTGTKAEPELDPDAPLPAPKPDTGTEVGTRPPPDPNPEVVTDPPESADPNTSSCFGEAASWNPVDWVYVPVKCSLIWAFKPKTALSARVETIRDTATVKAPFTWFAGFASVPAAVPGGACPDWRIKVADLDANVVCGSSYTDAIRSARPVLLVFMASLALWPLIRSTAYAAFPIIKPQPGMLR